MPVKNRAPDDEVIQAWRERRSKGESLLSIAIDYNTNRATVGKYCWDIKVKVANPYTYDRQYIVKLIDKGLSNSIIAQRVGCSRDLVRLARIENAKTDVRAGMVG